MPMTVKQACTLNEGALNIRISDGIERVDEETLNEEDGRRFLKHSYLTKGMIELVQEGFKRLSGGQGGRPVFRLKQAMGGGKTHLIKTMAFLARHEPLRAEFFSEAANRYQFGSAKVTFFNGREQPDDFFWGRVAAQIGHEGFFESGVKAPGENHWSTLFDKIDDPVLLLLDEMPTYFAYYKTQPIGSGTVADVAGRAFANLLTAAMGRKNICVVISDLEASHAEGTQIINTALENARKELSRVEFNITPVDLSGDETYAILKKRLFATLPDANKISHLAQQYAKCIEQAQKSRTIDQQKTPEQIAMEVEQTYPFHPQMKHLFALFKENKEFQQTRGLMELASRLLNSVWLRPTDDVMLIGPQHFNMSLDEVREKVISISRLDEAVAKDIYADDGGAHAQVIDANAGSDCATQAANLLLISSMSTAINPVKGLTKSEALECLASPQSDLSFFEAAIDSLQKSAWYLHRTAEGRIYFDKLENLTKMLVSMAQRAPEPKVKELVSDRLKQMFDPKRKSAYTKVLALPLIDEIQSEVQAGRILAILPPDSNLPPEEIVNLFNGLTRKNNLLILCGERSFEMDKLWDAARMVYAAKQAEAQRRVERGGPQWEEFEDLKKQFELTFTGVIKTLFDKLLFPFQTVNTAPNLIPRNLEQSGDTNDGEARIEATLVKDPIKLYLDWQDATKFSGIRSRVERLFGPQDDVAWSDVKDKAQTDCSMFFLPQGDLDKIKTRAINEGFWEDLGNGYITKKPKPKLAGVQVTPVGRIQDDGSTVLQVSVINANPDTTSVHYAEDGEVSEASTKLDDDKLTTKALRVAFLAIDHSERTEKAPPYVWQNKLLIQWEITTIANDQRTVVLTVLPHADVVRYTLNGAEPRNGKLYESPFIVGAETAMLMVFAEASGLEAKAEFHIPSIISGPGGVGVISTEPEPPLNKPVAFPTHRNAQITSRDQVFAAIAKAQERNIQFTDVMLKIQAGSAYGQFGLSGQSTSASRVQQALETLIADFPPSTPITLQFRAQFPTGQDLLDFAATLNQPYVGEWMVVV
jgi:hypothetical protein